MWFESFCLCSDWSGDSLAIAHHVWLDARTCLHMHIHCIHTARMAYSSCTHTLYTYCTHLHTPVAHTAHTKCTNCTRWPHTLHALTAHTARTNCTHCTHCTAQVHCTCTHVHKNLFCEHFVFTNKPCTRYDVHKLLVCEHIVFTKWYFVNMRTRAVQLCSAVRAVCTVSVCSMCSWYVQCVQLVSASMCMYVQCVYKHAYDVCNRFVHDVSSLYRTTQCI